ncbi:MAG: excinuclease ABC subunit UvrA [Clostridiales bacterium]|nr:excinuclease ABC subunit UvrA [Clostridiales bacterium]
MVQENIVIHGARQHNLKNIDITIPRDKLVVITGLSGSGKSSLAFDTIYAEGQRRYVESLSSYARQFLGQMTKPDVDQIEGLSPAISIDQKTTSRNPRSTVGTVTEIHDYLRLLYARAGRPHCHVCGKPISQQTVDQMIDSIYMFAEGSRLHLLAPLVRGRKGEHQKIFTDAKSQGYVRARVNGEIRELEQEIKLDKQKKHSIEIVVDRVVLRPDNRKRLADSLELALKMAAGLALTLIEQPDGRREELLFSQNFACPDCGVSLGEITPRMFSFNNPFGACPACTGLGFSQYIDEKLMIGDDNLTLREGAVQPLNSNSRNWYFRHVEAIAKAHGFSLDIPVKELPRWVLDEIFYGCGNETFPITYFDEDGGRERTWMHHWEGLVRNFERRHRETNSEQMREEFERYMTIKPCDTCGGARLKPESLAITVGGKNIYELSLLTVAEAGQFLTTLRLTERETLIAARILKELNERLQFLVDVGLDYLTLARGAASLSGGEAQRIRLATQIGSHLTGVLYILDEPSIGLHQRDNARLIEALKQLRDLGNSVLVVEHDEEMMGAADHIIDIGPGAGEHGGRVVAAGGLPDIMACENSLTGQYLSGVKQIDTPGTRRRPNGRRLTIKGAKVNNLRHIDVDLPLNLFICITGVSGSGKSSLINEILYKAAARRLNRAHTVPGGFDEILGLEYLDKVIAIDQSPIGRTPRSNPATYTGLFDLVRELYSLTPEAKARGYKPGRFSFNVRGGRCEACQGDGIIKIEMHFLPDIYVPCEVCKGARYNRETLDIYFKEKNIAGVLDMTVDEAAVFFTNLPRLSRKLQTLQDVGLGYIRLGQSATTLSGGEAQRVKLASELSRRSNGRTLYILDEPTTGLHTADIHRLLTVLNRLVEAGDTVIVIEHNLHVIKTADYIIDLGPEGGHRGGLVIASGSPEEVAANEASYTGQFLRKVLG